MLSARPSKKSWPPDLEQNETQGSLDAAVGYSLGYQREEFFMVRGPEEVSEIRIHDPLRPALYLFPHFAQGILRGSPSPISEASIIEYQLEDGLQPMGAG